MTRTTHTARTWALSLAALGCAAGFVTAPVASAQLPPGVSMQDVQAAISAPISVPAGETVTVDLGVPVSMGYAGGGWSVSSAGTSVTVTAPSTPGAQASVPATAAGQTAMITLVATENASMPATAAPGGQETAGGGETSGDGGSAADTGNTGTGGTGAGGAAGGSDAGETADSAPRGGDSAGTSGTTGATGTAPDNGADSDAQAEAEAESGAAAPTPTPERTKAEEVDTTETRYIDLDATIDGRTISAQLGLGQAADLYRQFQDLDQDAVKLRYLDVNGQVIEGVTRDIDMASRSLVLTYPEGQTPDNPFILQVVRDGAAILVVRLVSDDLPVARASEPADVPAEFDQPAQTAESSDSPVSPVAVILGLVALLAIVAVVVALAARSRRKRQA